MTEKCPEHPEEKMIACMECLFDTAEDEKSKYIGLIREVHDELDDLNANRGNLCLFCNASSYDGREGIKHERDCIIIKLRNVIKSEPK